MKQLSQIDKDVQGFLDSRPVKYSVVYIGQTAWYDTTADKFSVSFTKNNTTNTFDFYQGIGHREKRKDRTNLLEYITAFRKLIKQHVTHCIDLNTVLVFVPTSASVLYSLLSDSEAGQRTFPEFCHDFGYDEDSSKALDIYLACQNTSKQLNTIFKHGEISHLQTLLEDY